jgi:hypothetical protein
MPAQKELAQKYTASAGDTARTAAGIIIGMKIMMPFCYPKFCGRSPEYAGWHYDLFRKGCIRWIL